MHTTSLVIQGWGRDEPETVVAMWTSPVEVESLPTVLWMFPEGHEVAREQVAHFGKLTVCYYARDDEMTLFHGRGARAFYTFTKQETKPFTVKQFDSLQAEVSAKLGGKPLSGA